LSDVNHLKRTTTAKATTPPSPEYEKSEYEKRRDSNIRKNQEFLARKGLESFSSFKKKLEDNMNIEVSPLKTSVEEQRDATEGSDTGPYQDGAKKRKPPEDDPMKSCKQVRRSPYKEEDQEEAEEEKLEEDTIKVCKQVHTAPESFIDWELPSYCTEGEKLDGVKCIGCGKTFVGNEEQCRLIGAAMCYRVGRGHSVFVCSNMDCPDTCARCAPCHLRLIRDAPRGRRNRGPS